MAVLNIVNEKSTSGIPFLDIVPWTRGSKRGSRICHFPVGSVVYGSRNNHIWVFICGMWFHAQVGPNEVHGSVICKLVVLNMVHGTSTSDVSFLDVVPWTRMSKRGPRIWHFPVGCVEYSSEESTIEIPFLDTVSWTRRSKRVLRICHFPVGSRGIHICWI